jgi:hypothetical protein
VIVDADSALKKRRISFLKRESFLQMNAPFQATPVD